MSEAKHINKSLSALGNVIYALTASKNRDRDRDREEDGESERKSSHVPFRDSKLTRLLQDSLGGNAKTVLILAIASSRVHQQESINTLKFGERARQLTTKPTANTGMLSCVIVDV